MCDPLTLALTAGSMMLQHKMQGDAEQRQQDKIGQERGRQDRFQAQAQRAIEETLPEYEPERRAERQVLAQREAEAETAGAIAGAREDVGAGEASGVQGDVSPQYGVARSADVVRQIEEAIDFAKLSSAVRAPALAGQDERFIQLGLARDTDAARAGAGRSAGIADLEVAEAGKIDPLGQMFASALGAAGASGVGMDSFKLPGGGAPYKPPSLPGRHAPAPSGARTTPLPNVPMTVSALR